MSDISRRILVAGGGIAGLGVATALARGGWNVSLFEKAERLREDGACIWLGELAIASLEKVGAAEELLAVAEKLDAWEIRDHRDRVIQQGGCKYEIGARLVYVMRTDLHRSLVNAAKRAGVAMNVGAEAVAASPEGILTLSDGRQVSGDLVIGADGLNSAVRASLPLVSKVTRLRHISTRSCINTRSPHVPKGVSIEHWCGGRRLGYGWAGDGKLGIWASFPEPSNFDANHWFDRQSWTKSFPSLSLMMEEFEATNPRVGDLINVRCDRWSEGRAVLIGDAAHSMPPHFGQGGGLALLDSVSLARFLGKPTDITGLADIPEKLKLWESHHRRVVDTTQKYANLYAKIQTNWPQPIEAVRSAMLSGFAKWSSARVMAEGLLKSAK